jgi:hypothetical protein
MAKKGKTYALLVVYGYPAKIENRWNTFLDALNIPKGQSWVLDNHPQPSVHCHHGSNAQLEFSGYAEILELFKRDCPAISSNDRIVLFNDTLFAHHWTYGWQRWMKTFAPRLPVGVHGDGRIEPIHLKGKPLKIIASWHFVIVGTQALHAFHHALNAVCDAFEEPIKEPGYAAYLAHYLRPRYFGGVTQRFTPHSDAYHAKQKAIWAEHRLSMALDQSEMLTPYGQVLYQGLHGIDRAFSAWRRFRNIWAKRVVG